MFGDSFSSRQRTNRKARPSLAALLGSGYNEPSDAAASPEIPAARPAVLTKKRSSRVLSKSSTYSTIPRSFFRSSVRSTTPAVAEELGHEVQPEPQQDQYDGNGTLTSRSGTITSRILASAAGDDNVSEAPSTLRVKPKQSRRSMRLDKIFGFGLDGEQSTASHHNHHHHHHHHQHQHQHQHQQQPPPQDTSGSSSIYPMKSGSNSRAETYASISSAWSGVSNRLFTESLRADANETPGNNFTVQFDKLAKKHGIQPFPHDFKADPGSVSVSSASRETSSGESTPPTVRENFWNKLLRRSPSTVDISKRHGNIKMSLSLKRPPSVSDLAAIGKGKRDNLKGIHLEDIIRLGGVAVFNLPLGLAPGDLLIPTCVHAAASYILNHGLKTPGIFRVTGNINTTYLLYDYYQKQLEENNNEAVVATTALARLPSHISYNIHDVAQLLKKLIHGLPGGLLGSPAVFQALYNVHTFVYPDPSLSDHVSKKVKPRMIALALASVNLHFRIALICSVFGLLRAINLAQEQETESKVKDPHETFAKIKEDALGIVFGPLLLGDKSDQIMCEDVDDRGGLLVLPKITTPAASFGTKRGKSIKKSMDPAYNKRQLEKTKRAAHVCQMMIDNWENISHQLKKIDALSITAQVYDLPTQSSKGFNYSQQVEEHEKVDTLRQKAKPSTVRDRKDSVRSRREASTSNVPDNTGTTRSWKSAKNNAAEDRAASAEPPAHGSSRFHRPHLHKPHLPHFGHGHNKPHVQDLLDLGSSNRKHEEPEDMGQFATSLMVERPSSGLSGLGVTEMSPVPESPQVFVEMTPVPEATLEIDTPIISPERLQTPANSPPMGQPDNSPNWQVFGNGDTPRTVRTQEAPPSFRTQETPNWRSIGPETPNLPAPGTPNWQVIGDDTPNWQSHNGLDESPIPPIPRHPEVNASITAQAQEDDQVSLSSISSQGTIKRKWRSTSLMSRSSTPPLDIEPQIAMRGRSMRRPLLPSPPLANDLILESDPVLSAPDELQTTTNNSAVDSRRSTFGRGSRISPVPESPFGQRDIETDPEDVFGITAPKPLNFTKRKGRFSIYEDQAEANIIPERPLSEQTPPPSPKLTLTKPGSYIEVNITPKGAIDSPVVRQIQVDSPQPLAPATPNRKPRKSSMDSDFEDRYMFKDSPGSPGSKELRGNSALYAEIRRLQKLLDAKNEEAAATKKELELAQNMANAGTLSHLLRESHEEVKVWRNRAEWAEKQLKAQDAERLKPRIAIGAGRQRGTVMERGRYSMG